VNVIETGWFVELFAGETKTGAPGGTAGGSEVVKLLEDEKELVPPLFVALTRQKYVELFVRSDMSNDVDVIPVWSTTLVENAASSDT